MSIAVQPTPPQAAWRRRVLLGVGIAAVVLVVWGVLLLSGVGAGVSVFLAAVLSGVTAALASEPVARGGGGGRGGGGAGPAGRAPTPAAVPVPVDDTVRRLRHDLRGILSPALMTADRLLMTTEDPIAKRAAEAMIETVEAAERRLSV